MFAHTSVISPALQVAVSKTQKLQINSIHFIIMLFICILFLFYNRVATRNSKNLFISEQVWWKSTKLRETILILTIDES